MEEDGWRHRSLSQCLWNSYFFRLLSYYDYDDSVRADDQLRKLIARSGSHVQRLIATRKRGEGNSCVACQDSIGTGQKMTSILWELLKVEALL